MAWLIPLTVYFMGGSAGYLLRRVLAQRVHDTKLVNVCYYLLFVLPAAIVLGLSFPHSFSIPLIDAVLLVLGGMIWPVYTLVAFRANKDIDASVFSVINNASPLVTLLFAMLLMNEQLSNIQTIGMALLIVSGIVVTLPRLKRRHHAHMTGIWFAVLAVVMAGIAMAFDKFMLGRVEFGTYLLYGWGSQVVWMALISLKDLRKIPELLRHKKHKKLVVAYGISGIMRSVGFIFAMQLSSTASVVGAASNFMSVIVVIAAYFILRERDHVINKIIALVLGVVGLFLLK